MKVCGGYDQNNEANVSGIPSGIPVTGTPSMLLKVNRFSIYFIENGQN